MVSGQNDHMMFNERSLFNLYFLKYACLIYCLMNGHFVNAFDCMHFIIQGSIAG
jgi:hypothetical protein